jgi:putative endonuclease
LDIVARHGSTIVFVEVKAKRSRAFGHAVEAVDGRKRRRIVELALDYLARYRLTDVQCRFDVVSIDFHDGRPVIDVFENAFDASSQV